MVSEIDNIGHFILAISEMSKIFMVHIRIDNIEIIIETITYPRFKISKTANNIGWSHMVFENRNIGYIQSTI